MRFSRCDETGGVLAGVPLPPWHDLFLNRNAEEMVEPDRGFFAATNHSGFEHHVVVTQPSREPTKFAGLCVERKAGRQH